MIKVLVVDDSSTMRRIIIRMLEADDSIEVVGSARDGLEAIELVEKLKPDVVTMDVEMPRMNGIEALKHIMEKNPVPVIMFSALTKEGAQTTIEALEIGAVDFITKDFSNLSMSLFDKENELIKKVKSVAKNKSGFFVKRLKYALEASTLSFSSREIKREIVCIGSSTGGPAALEFILKRMPKDMPVPIVIAQHMPPLFTKFFSERLNSICEILVKEAENREPLKEGVAYIAPGDTHITIKKRGKEAFCEYAPDGSYVYRPSVDLLFLSSAFCFGSRALALILTGMGTDGKKGAKEVYSKGGYVIAQNEETCVVFGMPRAAIEEGCVNAILPLDLIPEELLKAI